MRIAVICNTDSLAMPVLSLLQHKGMLLEVSILAQHANQLVDQFGRIGIDRSRINLLPLTGWKEALSSWLERLKPDMTWVFAFPWQIPSRILQIPRKGFFNFHFGTLPKYKGADPIFWQIRNNEIKSDLTIHVMTERIDEGPVVLKYEMPLLPGENYGLLCHRMGAMAVGAVEKFLEAGQYDAATATEQANSIAEFYRKPDTSQLRINWKEQSADEIERLVNASNPKYGGATTTIRNMEVRLLEVSGADVSDAPEVEPGTIVYADAVYGIIAACKERKHVRINVVHIAEGYFSGTKLFGMGIGKGEKFE